jgi:hypothetical protein
LPAAHFPDQDARTGGGGDDDDGEDVFREMRRRKSSAGSAGTAHTASELATPPPPLPKRRQRQPSLNLSAHTRRASQNQNLPQLGGEGEGLLVVEAPVVEGSTGRDDEGSRERGVT